jgi:hypothetical protein
LITNSIGAKTILSPVEHGWHFDTRLTWLSGFATPLSFPPRREISVIRCFAISLFRYFAISLFRYFAIWLRLYFSFCFFEPVLSLISRMGHCAKCGRAGTGQGLCSSCNPGSFQNTQMAMVEDFRQVNVELNRGLYGNRYDNCVDGKCNWGLCKCLWDMFFFPFLIIRLLLYFLLRFFACIVYVFTCGYCCTQGDQNIFRMRSCSPRWVFTAFKDQGY